MTELGEIELRVLRTRRSSALGVVPAYALRSAAIDQIILACFVLDLSTRKVATALQPVLGRRISARTVSQMAKLQMRRWPLPTAGPSRTLVCRTGRRQT